MDKFLGFSEARILANKGDIAGANAAVESAVEVIELLNLQIMQFQVPVARGWISKHEGDYSAMAEYYSESVNLIEKSVLAGELSAAVPRIYAEAATGQVWSGQLAAAAQSIVEGFRLDPSEPLLWLAQARLQQARDMPRLALASANYALAIWQDADAEYNKYQEALSLAEDIAAQVKQ